MVNDLITLDMVLNLPESIRSGSKQYEEYSRQLSAKDIEMYYYADLRNDVSMYITELIKYKYTFKANIMDNIKTTVSYTQEGYTKGNSKNSQVENAVIKMIDRETRIKFIYLSLINCSKKLSKDESVYFIETFFSGNTEVMIMDKLLISKRSFNNIKKSCLIKIANELGILNIE